MNWMTSGTHRALYSQRGRRRQMHFPSQVQRQRVKPTSPPRSSQPARARDSATPWYIVPVGDDDESQDIRVLELERKGAMSATEVEADAEKKTEEPEHTGVRGAGSGARSSPSQKRSREHKEQTRRSDNRCIFTPVKKARKYDQPLGAVQHGKSVREERPPSSISSGVDMLFFNDGEELRHENRAQRTKRITAVPAPQHIADDGDQEESQQQHPHLNYRDEDLHSRSSRFDAQQSSDGGNSSFHGDQAFIDDGNKTDERDIQLWRVNSNSWIGSSPDSAFDHPDSASFRSVRDPIRESYHGTPPSSPLKASPLSFRMSRTEVLQSQLSARVSHASHDPLETGLSFTRTPRSSQSQSTSTSSQGSVVLGRPPLGWQKRLLLSMNEYTSDNTENRLSRLPGVVSSTGADDSKLERAQQPHNSLEIPLESSPSPSSSRGSGGDNSIIDELVPFDAKERIMAAATSQQLTEDSPSWFQRPVKTKLGNANGADTVFSRTNMALQQSWVMSSRTKTILDAVPASKALPTENAIKKHDSKYQEMESVAIYMYTLVQCYKIDEKIRSTVATQLPSEASSPTTAASLTMQTACRREVIFSPKRTN